ncbi:PEP-CTERM sorting domain-containing protein [Verrucomicrobiota bacterium sgz303538]
MKRFSLLCAALGIITSAQGATIVWQSFNDNGLTLADGATMLPVNSLVRLGYFDISDSVIQANATNLAFLENNFHQLDFDRIGGAEVLGNAGYFSESHVSLDPSLAGKQLVVWAFASSDNSSLSQSLATATQTGIFYSTKSNWLVPNDNPIPTDTTLELSDLTGAGPTAGLLTDGSAHVVLGSFSDTTAGARNAKNFALQVVPEPGTTGLAVVGGIAMLLRRRRRA